MQRYMWGKVPNVREMFHSTDNKMRNMNKECEKKISKANHTPRNISVVIIFNH